MEHLVPPLRKQGYSVDYYLSLTTEAAPAFRAGLGYMEHVRWDPAFGPYSETNPSHHSIGHVVMNQMAHAGARLRKFNLQEQVNIDGNPGIRNQRLKAKVRYPKEDPDLRFPTMDARKNANHAANIVANRNLLRLHYSVERLWTALRTAEEADGLLYNYVMFLRDDTMWLQDFDLNRLIAQGPADVYHLSCDNRVPRLQPEEMNDHGLVVVRAHAELFGKYLGALRKTDLAACARSLSASLSSGGLRGCNSEMLMKWIIYHADLKVRMVGQELMPFQRSMHLNHYNGSVVECFHKYCQSRDYPLPNHGKKKCLSVMDDWK